jgi:hypothetical protein
MRHGLGSTFGGVCLRYPWKHANCTARQGLPGKPDLYPALILPSLARDALERKDWSALNDKLNSPSLTGADFNTKVSKAIELEALRRLGYKNLHEP